MRPARPEDLARILEIEASSFSVPWSLDGFESLLDRGDAAIRVAEEEGLGGIAAYAVVWWVEDEGELANLAVSRERRGRGLGGAVLDAVLASVVERGVQRLYLEVRASNLPAIRLYRSRGFERIGIRKRYYIRPLEDAEVYQWTAGGVSPGENEDN